jgi:pimeloyl-CoA synthetase
MLRVEKKVKKVVRDTIMTAILQKTFLNIKFDEVKQKKCCNNHLAFYLCSQQIKGEIQ